MLKRMERAGIVERRPDAADGRVTRVHLTEAGRERERRTRAVLGAAIGAVLDSLSEPDRVELARLLDLVAERARQVAG
jgi:DNA-binding MarR family transcriptional regulator